MNSRFSGRSGLGSWFGNVPSGSKKYVRASIGSRSRIGGSITPAMPLAASMTTASGRDRFDVDEREHTLDVRGPESCGSTSRWLDDSCGCAARSRISSSPDSPPTGSAPRRTIFIPVYCFGLCDAVTMIPPSSESSPTAK